MRVRDKVVIVTGGCSGIGESCVELLMQNGAKVIIFDITESKNKNLIKKMEKKGEYKSFYNVDVSTGSQVEKAMH